MAKIAVRTVIDSLFSARPMRSKNEDLIVITGKGRGSVDGIRVLMPEVKNFLLDEFNIKSFIDENNTGRLIIQSEELINFVDR